MNKYEIELQNMESEMHDLNDRLLHMEARQRLLGRVSDFTKKKLGNSLSMSFEDMGGDIHVIKLKFFVRNYEPVEFPLTGVAQTAFHIMVCNFLHHVLYGDYPTPLYVSLEYLRDWANTESSKSEHNEQFRASLRNLYQAVKDVMRYM